MFMNVNILNIAVSKIDLKYEKLKVSVFYHTAASLDQFKSYAHRKI